MTLTGFEYKAFIAASSFKKSERVFKSEKMNLEGPFHVERMETVISSQTLGTEGGGGSGQES